MKRRLFNALVLGSLALYLITNVLWARTAWHPRSVLAGPITVGEKGYILFVNEGRLSVLATWETAATQPQARTHDWPVIYIERVDDVSAGQSTLVIGFPIFILVIACIVFPFWWLWRHLRLRAANKGLPSSLCPTCGYDLRATPDRCPECGAISLSSSPAAQRSPI